MKCIKQYSCYYWIIIIMFFPCLSIYGQREINVQVKVYDKNLNAQSGVEIKIDNKKVFTTNARGLAFITLPEKGLPPADVKVNSELMEVESWNYSKGVLEIILREKKYKQVRIQLTNNKDKSGIPDVLVSINTQDTVISSRSNSNGVVSLTLPVSLAIDRSDDFVIEGYIIVKSELNDSGGVLFIEKQPTAVESKPQVIPNNKDLRANENVLKDIQIENLDSVTSITVLYSLIKKLNMKELDEDTKRRLDSKFNELLNKDLKTRITARNPLELITDSSIVNDDIKRIAERIELERQLLIDFRDKFENASDKIQSKLKDGGQNLDVKEREELIQEVLDLRELLRQNEELFYKNNSFYNQQVNALLTQLADIYELEDLLNESEAETTKMRENILIFFFAFVALSSVIVLLIYMVRVFRSQKNELAIANAKIQEMNTNLEGLINEKTESLRQINNELDTFLYRSSHNLKGPLTTIKGLANIAGITLGKDATTLFEKVVLTTNGMERMLDKLTMMNHLNQPEDFKEVNINQLVNILLDEHDATLKRKKIAFSAHLNDGILFHTYPYVFEIILFNLLENAIHFSQFTHDEQPKVDLKIWKDQEENLWIKLWDNGCGINPEVMDKIYNMFFIGNEGSNGSGLGLYITKKAVETLNGKISVDSEVNKYCEVSVKLPVFDPSDRLLATS